MAYLFWLLPSTTQTERNLATAIPFIAMYVISTEYITELFAWPSCALNS